MTIKIEDFDFDNIIIDEKSHKNILIYGIPQKTLIGANPLIQSKINRFIRVYDGTNCLVLFGLDKYDAIHSRDTL